MVETETDKSACCQICVVDADGNTILNKLVKPPGKIVNYNTRWSGVTEEMLKDVTLTLQDVHKDLKLICGPNTILVGHSLENDLHTLKLIHTRIIDTSVLFPHARGNGRKNSLKYLANKYLKRKIQKGDGVTGHSPDEDALAALDLYKLKLVHGPMWDVHFTEKNSLFRLIVQAKKRAHVFGSQRTTKPLRSLPVDITLLPKPDEDPEAEGLVKKGSKAIASAENDFVWLELRRSGGQGNSETMRVNDVLRQLWESVPKQSVVVVYTGRRPVKRLTHLQRKKVLGRVNKGPVLNKEEEAELKALDRQSKQHHFWIAVKRVEEEENSPSG